MSDAEAVIAGLRERGQTIATCESLTGGLVAAALTDVAGSSVAVRGGLVTYATELKVALAGVPADVVAAGVVTQATAVAMALGARDACQAQWGVATTGVAGPGPQDGVAAGTAWIAVAWPGADGAACVTARELQLFGDRAAVRSGVVQAALAELRSLLAQPL